MEVTITQHALYASQVLSNGPHLASILVHGEVRV